MVESRCCEKCKNKLLVQAETDYLDYEFTCTCPQVRTFQNEIDVIKSIIPEVVLRVERELNL